MDDKTMMAVATKVSLFKIQINASVLLLELEHPNATIREDFQRLTSEGGEAVGIETMEAIKSRIQGAILQQEQ